MCGICGKVYSTRERKVDPATITQMMETMRHRGPDDDGQLIKGHAGLGHRRLSIIDLGAGRQPIPNEDGSIWIVFNGEIYNYKELQKFLKTKGHIFKTASDTEVIVHLYEELGLDFVSKLRGMFAFAIWDDPNELLLLARDRVGIKPLYYSLTDNAIVFASEMKAILADPSFRAAINPRAIDTFLTFLYTPGQETLFKNVYKLEPGYLLSYKNGQVKTRQYWDLRFSESRTHASLRTASEELLTILKDSVKCHLISDVPVGVLLSGGIDSTAMLGLAREITDEEICSFTIGFEGQRFADERPYAKLAAGKFGAKHFDLTITAQDYLSFLPKYIWHMEEPVCEGPAVALYYVSKLASEHVKVVLSGEGGDEAFAGYQNYRNLVWLERIKRRLAVLNGMTTALFSKLEGLPLFRKAAKYSRLMALPMEAYYYSRTATPFSFFNQNKNELYSEGFRNLVNGACSCEILKRYFETTDTCHDLNKMLYVDTKTWLVDDLLIKADRITMANSLELRVPLLDHKVLEFAASLPVHYKLRGWSTKYILKKALSQKVPKEILHRKKTGFPLPDAHWLTNDIKHVPYEILLDKRARERGYFKPQEIETLINKNLENANYTEEIFSLIILELWHRLFIDRVSATMNI